MSKKKPALAAMLESWKQAVAQESQREAQLRAGATDRVTQQVEALGIRILLATIARQSFDEEPLEAKMAEDALRMAGSFYAQLPGIVRGVGIAHGAEDPTIPADIATDSVLDRAG